MFFSRFDNFEDRLEGGINRANFPSISNSLEVMDAALRNWPGMQPRSEREEAELQNIETRIQNQTFFSIFGLQNKIDGDAFLERVSSWLYASCWTDLSHECQAMWQLYGSSGSSCRHGAACVECSKTLGNSVCIETTVGSIMDSLEMKEDYNFSVRKVEYLDRRASRFADGDMTIRPFFSKALHFSYENEVRFMLWPDRKDIMFSYKYNQSTVNDIQNEALKIKNMQRFIGRIILSPLPFKKANDIRMRHMDRYKSALGLEDELSNSDLKIKVLSLLRVNGLDVNVIDSDLNQVSVTDCYTYGE
jgi:hypothetical protein